MPPASIAPASTTAATMTPDLLVTGFGPFPGARVNPAGPIAQAVASRASRRGLDARALVLHTSYGVGLPALAQALRTLQPRAVLMIGLTSRDRQVRVERLARPGATALLCDASGRRLARVGGAAASLRATGDANAALARLKRHGLSARMSMSAGRYLCNAAYAEALAWAKALAVAHGGLSPAPVLFIHIPRLSPLPGVLPRPRRRTALPKREALTTALAAIAIDLAGGPRRRRPRA
jgi:pyroglutamyl-peptidase